VDKLPPHIPTEVYIGFLGRSIEVHWNYHALLMFSVWMVLVPFCIIAIRFFKPKPSQYGITTKIRLGNIRWWWFSVHKYGLFTAVGLSLGGAAVALVASGGFSGSVHSMFGSMTILMGCLQVVSALFRGTHGGKYYNNAKPDDPSTWRGDHYDYTLRRRMFEAYHRSSGYFTSFFALGAVGSGLMQYPFPVLRDFAFVVPILFLLAWIVLEFMGRRHDGYRAVFGFGLEHPHNEARKEL
jgi:hypothetical protein